MNPLFEDITEYIERACAKCNAGYSKEKVLEYLNKALAKTLEAKAILEQ